MRGKAPNFNGHIVHLALHLWGLPQIIKTIQNLLKKTPFCLVRLNKAKRRNMESIQN